MDCGKPADYLWRETLRNLDWQVFDLIQEILLKVLEQNDGLSVCSCPCCPSDSVDVLLSVCWQTHLHSGGSQILLLGND